MKLQANELRIGNYVRNKITKRIDAVEAISPDKEIVPGYSPPATIDFFEPIPLTEEWLKRLGLEYNGAYWECEWCYFELDYYKDHFINGVNACEYNHGIEIKYVHQLQNLYFSLTGQELKYA